MSKNANKQVRNQKELVPLHRQNETVSLSLGKSLPKEFQQTNTRNSTGKQFQSSDPQQTKRIFEKLKNEDPNTIFLISLNAMGRVASFNFGLNTQEVDLINHWAQDKRVILSDFANTYSLSLFVYIDTVS